MEREFGEVSLEIEDLGLSEAEEDKVIENPTVSVKQQQKKSRAASAQKQSQKGSIYVHQVNTVWKAKSGNAKKKKDVFVT